MMYKLPKIPYTMDKDQSAEIPFRGINYSDRLSAGDLADSHGISLRRWPLVTNKRGRERIGEEGDKCRHVTTHDNNIIRFLDSGQINMLDWQVIGSWDETDDRSRRFANINSKTVIMPDKKYIEFPSKESIDRPEVKSLEEKVYVSCPKFEKNAIQGHLHRVMDVFGGTFSADDNSFSGSKYLFNQYEVMGKLVIESGTAFCMVTGGNFKESNIIGLSLSANENIVAKITQIEQGYDKYQTHLYLDFLEQYDDGTYDVDIYELDSPDFGFLEKGDVLTFDAGAGFTQTYTIDSIELDKLIFKEYVTNEIIDELKKITVFKSVGSVFSGFNKGDTVTISGCSGERENNNRSFTIRNVIGNKLYATENIFKEGEDPGLITISRTVPELDFICEAENRLWGCNNKENVIYISALGDPTNMYTYEGLTTDSFATAVGSPGDFTGCCRYGSSVLFFKEDKIHKILGTEPADYTLYSYDVEGIQKGSDKSAVVINEVLYYKGTHGIYAYDGGVPTLISECFGERIFYDAVAGTDGVSYFVSMRDERYVWYLFSYNTTTGIWTLEDKGFEARDAMRVGMELYFLDKEGQLWKENAVSDVSRSEWMMQFAPLYETMNGKKTYSRILLCAELPKGSYMAIEMRCDGGEWVELGKIVGKSSGIVPIRIPVNRCDKFEIRLSGKGEFVLREMLREYCVAAII